MPPERRILLGKENLKPFVPSNARRSDNVLTIISGFATALGIAATFAGATVFTFATIVAAFATALPFATIFALAIMLARVRRRGIRTG